jgi:archaellum component FlaC
MVDGLVFRTGRGGMDQELVQYLDGRFNELNERIDDRFGEVNRRFSEVDERFNGMEGRFNGIEGRFTEVNQRFHGIDERFNEVYERIDEVKRHNGVLIEGLRHELHLVADGLLMHVEVRHREDRDYFDHKFEDMATLFRGSHDHLQQQQDELRESQNQLRLRMENLEQNRPQ